MTKGDATRQRILDAAAADAAHHGLDNASVNRIARAAGLKPGSLYFHFDSRDNLLDAMLEAGLDETMRHLDRGLDALDDNASAADRLRAAVRAHLEALHELSDYARVVLSLTNSPRPTGEPYRRLLERYITQWTQIVSAAQAAGVIASSPDPRLLRDLIFGALNQTLVRVGDDGRSIDDVSDALIALLFCSPASVGVKP